MIYEFVRNNKGHKIGVVVALDNDRIGWSKCNIKKDKFDKRLGLVIAKGRANAINPVKPVPSIMRTPLGNMVMRAQRYFKAS